MEISKNKKEIIVLAVLAVVLLVMMAKLLSGSKRPRPRPRSQAAEGLPAATGQMPLSGGVEGDGIDAYIQEKSRLRDKYIRDIFDLPDALKAERPQEKPRPVQKAEEKKPEVITPPDIRISGVIWGGGRPTVFSGGEVYRKGDFIQEAQITGIHREGIEILYKGKTFFIEREEAEVKF